MHIRSICFSFIVLSFLSQSVVIAGTNKIRYQYVINLSSSSKPEKISIEKSVKQTYMLYQVKVRIKNKTWYKQRLGFFRKKQTARQILKIIKKNYPEAWIDKIYNYDIRYIKQWKKNTSNNKLHKTTKLSVEQQISLLEQARQHFLDGDYKKAIPIFKKIYESGHGKFRQEALELLGVSRERNGQLAHAIAEYKIYLKQYANDQEATERVSQRIKALLTAAKKPRKPLNKPNMLISKPSIWQYNGALFQFYDKNEIDISSNSNIVSAEQLTTNLSFSSRLINSEYKIKTQFNAIHGYDVSNDETDDQRITNLYIDLLSPSRTYSIRAGRQRSSSNGAIGRFDGFDMGYRFDAKAQIKLITGYPVEFNPTVKHHDDKYFTSLGLNIQPDQKHIDYNFFIVEQVADGLTDRKEVGAEFRYRHPRHSLITLYDYSVQYEKTNYLVAIFDWKYLNNSSINIYLDYRQSPFLSTTNALQGQVGVSTLNDLLLTLSADEIEQLSTDRSAISRSMTLKYRIPQNKKIEYQTDVSFSSLSGTVASGGVAATTDTGTESSLAFSLLGRKWLMANDNYLFRIRSSQLATSDANIIDISARYRFNKNWRIGPRLRFDERDYDDGRNIKKNRVSFRVDYKHNRNISFEFDFSVENKNTTSLTASPLDETDHILHLGYIYLF